MKILVLNGPNLNMLGIREPEVYGSSTYEDLCEMIKAYCKENNIDVEIHQSNCEGKLVSMIQQAYFDKVDGIVFNPAAYTHTSIALLDALKSVNINYTTNLKDDYDIVHINLGIFDYVETPGEVPKGEVTLIERLYAILNNLYSTDIVTNSRDYLINETIQKICNTLDSIEKNLISLSNRVEKLEKEKEDLL